MQQLFITIVAMLSVIAPIAISKLRRMLITPRLLKLFQHAFLTSVPPHAVGFHASADAPNAHQFAGSPDWERLLAYARSGRSFCIYFVCRLFPKPV